MSAKIMTFFRVTATVSKHNVRCSTNVLAETDLEAIAMTKSRLESTLLNFASTQPKRSVECNVSQSKDKLPADFWDGATINAEPYMQAVVLHFVFDRIIDTEPFKL